jgi:ribosome recycling factor
MNYDSADDVLLEADDKMQKCLEFLSQEFAGIRTGKASPSLVENVQVPYYGTLTRLREIAGIATPEARLIVLNSYDPTALPAIEKAILAANLGVTPMNDGRVIRIVIPELSEERRREMTKIAKRMAEESRVAVRNVRREANEAIKALQKDGRITEDERDQALAQVQKDTDACIGKIDQHMTAKEKEIMAV